MFRRLPTSPFLSNSYSIQLNSYQTNWTNHNTSIWTDIHVFYFKNMEKQIGEFSHVHVTEKRKRKFGFSFPMSIKKTFEIYDDCLFLIMLACPNEQFIKYIVGFSCILVFFFMNLHCILCLILQVRKISHPNNIYHPMSMDINSKLRAVWMFFHSFL